MKKPIRKWTAAWAAIAFTWMAMGIISPGQLKAGTAKAESVASTVEAAKSESINSFEKEGTTSEIVKKKRFPWPYIIAGALVVGIVVYFTLIKKTKHILIVETETGVTGTPAAGRYVYKKGEKIKYNFGCTNDYKDLKVFLDEKMTAASGTIIMDKAHTIRVEATRLVDYRLTINIDEGITGYPPRGTRSYREGTTVTYHYAFSDLSLIVKLDGNPVPNIGSLVMDKDHILEVTFGPPPDIRGKWRLLLKGEHGNYHFPLDLLFSGTNKSGTCKVINDPTNNPWQDFFGDTGTYEVSSNLVTIRDIGDGAQDFSFYGNFTSSNSILGNFSCVGDEPMYYDNGTWTATRIK